MSKPVRICLAALGLLASTFAGSADAAARPSGSTIAVIAALTRGTAVAYDSVNKVYLVVGSHGVLWGRFVQKDGTPLGTPFTIQANPANFAHFPRAAFSPNADGGAGAFLVTWHEGAPSPHARMVSYPRAGAYGSDTQLTADVSWWEAGAAVAYSSASREFLVAWRRIGGVGVNNDIRAVRVDETATPKSPVFSVTNDVDYQDNPSIAYNPVSDEFLVVFAGYNDARGFAFVDAQRVKAGGNTLAGAATRLVQTGGTYITDVTYNFSTNKYLAAWYALPGAAEFGRVVNADGSLSGSIVALSTRWKAYDALSIAYNRVSDTFLMVSHGTTADDGAVEIDTNGNPVDNGFIVTNAGGKGNFYPRVGASADEPNWLVSTANNFTSTMTQLVSGTAASGTPAPSDPTPAPAPAPAPVPAPAVGKPMLNVDVPANNAVVSSSGFLIAGWALDASATSTVGVDAVVAWAWPSNGGAAILAGVAGLGYSRPDVGAAFGSQFSTAGFGLNASLPPGQYTLAVYIHSTVDGKWNDPRVTSVTVQAPTSAPRMQIDIPAQNQTISQNVTVAGWALDLAATTTSGVDAIHVYAYPSNGAAPIWLGAATLGIARPDVGNAFGAPRYNAAGFHLNTTLGPGSYTLVVFAHSSVTGTFNNAQAVPITVR